MGSPFCQQILPGLWAPCCRSLRSPSFGCLESRFEEFVVLRWNALRNDLVAGGCQKAPQLGNKLLASCLCTTGSCQELFAAPHALTAALLCMGGFSGVGLMVLAWLTRPPFATRHPVHQCPKGRLKGFWNPRESTVLLCFGHLLEAFHHNGPPGLGVAACLRHALLRAPNALAVRPCNLNGLAVLAKAALGDAEPLAVLRHGSASARGSHGRDAKDCKSQIQAAAEAQIHVNAVDATIFCGRM